MITIQSNALIVQKDLLAMLADLQDVDKILSRATFDSFVMIKQRVQQRGEKTNGEQIGEYQGTPANPVKTKSGRSIKHRTPIAGYAKIRQDAGRQIGYIDLSFTGDMLDRGFSVIKIDSNTFGIGFVNDPSADKARWLEQRFGTIFQNSEEEIKDFLETVLIEVNQIVNAG